MDSINIKDIARMCGVSVSTVSRAINNHPDINEETRKKVKQVIEENNYIPNNSARNLKRSEARTIAVLIKGISNPFFSQMLRVFEQEMEDRRYSLIIHRIEEKENEVDVAMELIKEKRLKGIIFLGGYFSHTKEKLEQLSVPFILSTIGNTGYLDQEMYSSVSVDDKAESYKVTDYLCSQGHKKIAILASFPDDESIGKLRLEGYRDALAAHGIQPDESLCFYMKEDLESYSMECGYAMMKEALESGNEFSAVYAISDSVAIGACKAIFDAGKQIPEDYSVAGFDGLDIAHYYQPSLTTLRQPVEDMAKETVRILFDVIRNKSSHKQVTFPGELVIGGTVKRV